MREMDFVSNAGMSRGPVFWSSYRHEYACGGADSDARDLHDSKPCP
jgi:hypothetical protein